MLGRNSAPWGWWGPGPGCPEKLWLPPPWQCSRPGWMELWATRAGGRCPCWWQGGWNQMIFKVPSNPNHSMNFKFHWFLGKGVPCLGTGGHRDQVALGGPVEYNLVHAVAALHGFASCLAPFCLLKYFWNFVTWTTLQLSHTSLSATSGKQWLVLYSLGNLVP